MAGFEDRFSAETYAGDEPVSVGCASRDGGIDRVAEIPESIFVRAQLVADAYALHQLPAIDRNRETRINRQQCRSMVEEINFLLQVINDPLLAEHLRALREAAQRCADSPFDVQLVLVGP